MILQIRGLRKNEEHYQIMVKQEAEAKKQRETAQQERAEFKKEQKTQQTEFKAKEADFKKQDKAKEKEHAVKEKAYAAEKAKMRENLEAEIHLAQVELDAEKEAHEKT